MNIFYIQKFKSLLSGLPKSNSLFSNPLTLSINANSLALQARFSFSKTAALTFKSSAWASNSWRRDSKLVMVFNFFSRDLRAASVFC